MRSMTTGKLEHVDKTDKPQLQNIRNKGSELSINNYYVAKVKQTAPTVKKVNYQKMVAKYSRNKVMMIKMLFLKIAVCAFARASVCVCVE